MTLEEVMQLEVTIVGKIKQKISDIPASVELITADEIKEQGYRNLQDILENVPGLYVINNYAWTGPSFGVRGYSTQYQSHVIVLIDGVNQFAEFQADYEIEQFNIPVESIDRIEVIRGPMSVMYGSGAFFGAINIITNEAAKNNNTSLLSTSVGNVRTKKVYMQTSGTIEDFEYSLHTSSSYTYGIDRPFSELVSDVSALTIPADALSTGGRLEKNRKSLSFSGKFKGFYTNLQFLENTDEIYVIEVSIKDGSQKIHTTNNLQIGYRRDIGGKFLIDTKFTYLTQRKFIDLALIEDLVPMYFGDLNTKAYEFESNLHFNNNSNFDAMVGVNIHSAFHHIDFWNLPYPTWNNAFARLLKGERATNRALFVQANYRISDKIKLTGGM